MAKIKAPKNYLTPKKTVAQSATSWSTAAKNVGSTLKPASLAPITSLPTGTNLLSPAVAKQVSSGGFNNVSAQRSSGGSSSSRSSNITSDGSALTSNLSTSSISSLSLPTGTSVSSPSVSLPTTNVITTPTLNAQNTKLTLPEATIPDYSQVTPAPIVVPETKEKDTALQDYLKTLSKETPSSEEAYAKAQRETQILQKQQLVNDLTGQLNAIVNRGQAQQLAQVGQGRGIPEAIIGGIQAQIGRETAIAALPIQAQLSAAQGNLEMANSNLETLFKIYSDDAEREYNIRKEQKKMVYDIATEKEKRALEKLGKAEDRRYQEKQVMIKDGKDYAKMALANGQSSLGAKIMGLNPNSPTYQNELVNLISQVKDPNFQLDLSIKKQQLAKLQKETSLLGEPTAKEKKETDMALKEAKSSIPVMNDKIEAVDVLLNHSGLPTRIGTGFLSRKVAPGEGFFGKLGVGGAELIKTGLTLGIGNIFDITATATGAGQDFAGGVHKLVGGLTLQSLIDAKSRGATFGALSDSELNILANSASAINDWEIKDSKGNGVGIWNIDEGSFKTELKNIQDLTRRALLLSQGTLLTPEEQGVLNTTFSPDNMPVDPSNYY